MKNTFLIISIILAPFLKGQELFFTPIIGTKIEVGRFPGFNDHHFNQPKNNIIENETYWFFPTLNICFGGRLEYRFSKSNISIGYILNDLSISKNRIKFNAIENGEVVEINKEYSYRNRLNKIPISYQYNLYHNKKESFHLDFYSGINLIFPEFNWKNKFELYGDTKLYQMSEPSLNGNYIEISKETADYFYFTQKKLFLSFDVGLNFSFKINNKYTISSSIYFEKTLSKKVLGGDNIRINYNNGEENLYLYNGTRGNGLHLKFYFPLQINNNPK